jgi:DNA-binding SARP family transcriptional activator/tetratricopeptide (TPR) repeat protein
LEVREADGWAQIGAPKVRALLATLLAAPGQVVPTERLVDELWGDAATPGARKLVSQYVLRLRRLIGDPGGAVLATKAPGYRLAVDRDDLDAGRFESLLAGARESMAADDPGQAARQCADALAMWRGPALADVPLGPLAAAEAGRLDELRLAAAELRIEADLRRGLATELVPELRRLTGAHPLRERLWGQLVRALAADGRTAEALAACGQARQVIADELGADPGPDLQRLYHQLLADNPPPHPNGRSGAPLAAGPVLSRDAGPPGQSRAAGPVPRPAVAPVPRQLPGAVVHFVGRDRELDRLSALLAEPRDAAGPVVISAIGGTAGVGKTALAVHWAHQAAGRFPDGQLYVNLRGYDPGPPIAPGDALAGFLRALGLPGQEIPAEVDERAAKYRSMLAGRRVLVVLDNARDSEQVRPLLPGTPACVTVVTSRSSLAGLVAHDGARRLELDLLAPGEAVGLLRALIGERAAIDPAATSALADRCGRLPLALRVAAERAAARPATPLADLVTELADEQRRLDFLGDGGDPRTTARSVFSWSYRQLDDAAARVFRQASAHPGADFDAYAMAALAGTTLEVTQRLLGLLARVHLIRPAGPDRYGMHDLLRAYAGELHAEHDEPVARRAALTRLFDHYLRVSVAAMDALFPGEHDSRYRIPPPEPPTPPVNTSGLARAWLDAQRATLVVVAGQAATQGWPRHAIMLASTLNHYLRSGGHWVEAVFVHWHALHAARVAGDLAAQAAAMIGIGAIDWEQGRWGQAAQQFEQARSQSRDIGDRRDEADALACMALADYQQGRSERALGRLERAVALYREVGNRPGEARALGDIGGIQMMKGRYGPAAVKLWRSLELARDAGNRPLEAQALTMLGAIAARLGHHGQGTAYQEQALAVFQDIGNPNGQADVHFRLGHVDWQQGRYHQARDHLRQALALYREIGDGPSEAQALAGLGVVDLREGHYDRAADLLEHAVALAHETADRNHEAFALAKLGDVCQGQGRYDQAGHSYHQALALLRETGERPGQAAALNGLGELALATGEPGDAHRQHAAALDLATETGPPYEQARAHDGLGRACLALDRTTEARQHWEEALALYVAFRCPEADDVRGRLSQASQPGQDSP